MRMFLPIKGPGGRYLSPREKVALLILGITLILCVLTLLAGDAAYEAEKSRNPVSAFVSLLCRTFGGGIVALYALVLVWSGLIYFKGERAVDMRPLAGRMFAALCVTLGVSGVLGIAHLETAGSLGLTVGAAIGNTFGATLGFPILIVLMLLGVHLAGQGAWHAIKEPVRASVGTGLAPGGLAPPGLGFGLQDAPQGRFTDESPLPDDGDPTADERTLAVTQAMEEIERSQGVTIVDVESEVESDMDDERPSIGEEVDAIPEPHPETEEAQVQRGLADVASVLDPQVLPQDIETEEDVETEEDIEDEEEVEDEAEVDEDRYESENHGFVPVPAGEADRVEEDECVEAVFEGDEDVDEEEDEDEEEEEEVDDEGEYLEADEDEEYEDDDEEEDDDDEGEYLEADEDEEEEDVDEDDDEEEEDDDEGEYLEADDEEVDEEPTDEDEFEDEEEEVESGFAVVEDEALEEDEPEPGSDPYAQGGLVRRARELHGARTDDEDRPYTAFDWRGRPLE